MPASASWRLAVPCSPCTGVGRRGRTLCKETRCTSCSRNTRDFTTRRPSSSRIIVWISSRTRREPSGTPPDRRGRPSGLATARAYRQNGGQARVTMLSSEPYAPYNRPPLTKDYLRGETPREDLPIEGDGWYEENEVDFEPVAVALELDRDRQIVATDDGEELAYDACVLATGSEPTRLPVPGTEDPEILTMRTIENSDRLQGRVGAGDRVIVVGSGFIGCEAAASLSLRGARVTL